jgi:hypothetical protein
MHAFSRWLRLVALALAIGAGTLAGLFQWRGQSCCATATIVPVFADFDADGVVDTATLRDDRITVSLSDRRIRVRLEALSDTVTFVAADVDHDGDTDLVSLDSGARLRGWNNQGDGSFRSWMAPPPREPFRRSAAGGIRHVSGEPSAPSAISRSNGHDILLASTTMAVGLRQPLARDAASSFNAGLSRSRHRTPRAPPALIP